MKGEVHKYGVKYIFQNIVRTGGAALTKVLQDSFSHQTYESSVTASVEMAARRGIHYNEALKVLPVDQSKEIYIASFYHGFHTILKGRSKYIAVFRNPLERAISYVNAIYPKHVSSFGSWLRVGATHEVDNYLTRALVQDGIHRACNEDLLREAKNNLMSHYIVGVGDALPDVIDRINRVTGKNMQFDELSGFGAEQITVPVTAADKQQFRQRNAHDYRLYEFVKGLGELQSGRGIDAEAFHGKEA